MQELLEQQFDAQTARKLKFALQVSTSQQHDAKERLMRCAAAQTVLPALETAAARTTLRDYASVVRQHTLRLLKVLLLDSAMYERARRPPCFHQFYNIHSRYQFAIVVTPKSWTRNGLGLF